MITIPPHVRDFLEATGTCVVATQRADGSPRLSVTYFLLDGDRILISTESQRGKARDIERTGRASVCVFGHAKPFPAVTIEGPAVVLRTNIGDASTRLFSMIFGQPVDPISDEVLAQRGRVILELIPERLYGENYVPGSGS